jgi:hypothetical protein
MMKEKFNEFNVEHLAAFNHLVENGVWPDGFEPTDCEESGIWLFKIVHRMACAYARLGVNGHIMGMPPYETINGG